MQHGNGAAALTHPASGADGAATGVWWPLPLQSAVANGELYADTFGTAGKAQTTVVRDGSCRTYDMRPVFKDWPRQWAWFAAAKAWIGVCVDPSAQLVDLLEAGVLRMSVNGSTRRLLDGFCSIDSAFVRTVLYTSTHQNGSYWYAPSTLAGAGAAIETAMAGWVASATRAREEMQERQEAQQRNYDDISDEIERILDARFAHIRATVYVGMDNPWLPAERDLFARCARDLGVAWHDPAALDWSYWSRAILKEMKEIDYGSVHDFRTPDEVFRHAERCGLVARAAPAAGDQALLRADEHRLGQRGA